MNGQNRRTRQGSTSQPLGAPAYAILSLVSFVIALGVGWYLLNNQALLASSTWADRGYYVLLVIVGLATAAFLFGAMRSFAILTDSHLGTVVELGGPVVVFVLVVVFGFYLTKPPEQFSLTLRLRSDQPILDASDTFALVDLDERRRREFSTNGEAIIPGVSAARFKGREIQIQLESNKYRMKNPGYLYRIPDDAIIYLDVIRNIADLNNSIVIPNEILLTQRIGIPLVNMHFKFTNNIGRLFVVTEMSLTVTPPSGSENMLLLPIFSKVLISPFTLLPLKDIPVPVGMKNNEITNVFGRGQQEVQGHIERIKPKMPFHFADFCTQVRELPDVVSKELLDIFDRNFFWKPGRYTAKFSVTVDGTRFEKPFAFSVTQAQSEGLRNVRSDLRNCEGIGLPIMMPDLESILRNRGSSTNSVRVSLG